MTRDAQLILAVGAVLAAGVLAAGLAARLRLPALILFAGLGMLVGSDGLGFIAFDDYRLARLIGTIALVLILFEGGLASGWSEVRPVLRPALLLAVVGTMATAATVGLAASTLFNFSLLEGVLLGAILAATDGAAVFALMRGVRLPVRLRRTLEGESGFNDPVAVLLVLVAIDLITNPQHGVWRELLFMLHEVAVGAAVGLAGGLVPAAPGTRTGSRAAWYWPARSRPRRSRTGSQAPWEAPGSSRCTWSGSRWETCRSAIAGPWSRSIGGWRWGGLRGAVPVILATFAVIAGVPRGIELLNIVFFAVLLSAALQGATVEAVANRVLPGAATR